MFFTKTSSYISKLMCAISYFISINNLMYNEIMQALFSFKFLNSFKPAIFKI